jgi:hypothetical protein
MYTSFNILTATIHLSSVAMPQIVFNSGFGLDLGDKLHKLKMPNVHVIQHVNHHPSLFPRLFLTVV